MSTLIMDSFSFIKFYSEGGFFMHPLLMIMVIATTFCIKQYLNLNYNFTVREKFFSKIKILIKDGRVHEAYQCTLTTSHPLSKVLAAILYNSNKGKDVIESATKIEVQKVLPYIKSEINHIAISAKMAMIVGAAGFIQGAISSFVAYYLASGPDKMNVFMLGMALACHPLLFGLLISIPNFILDTYFNNKAETILNKYNDVISEVTHLIIFKPQFEVVNEDLSDTEYRRYGT